MKHRIVESNRNRVTPLVSSAALTVLIGWSTSLMATTPPAVPISQLPLTISIPAHPQIMLAVANSESMDGNLSGAIMTGSGSLGGSFASLNASSSPATFTVPTGFTPPLDPGLLGSAPYTVNNAGTRFDNSPSRLNVAKAGITTILANYMTNADFGLLDYNIGGPPGVYQTWVYQMSPPGGFTFTSVVATTGQVANPCYQANVSLGDPVSQNCQQLAYHYFSQNITSQPYMNVQSSSDDPSINDVLYSGYQGAVCIVFGGPNPPNPYNYFSLNSFNSGGVYEYYWADINNCPHSTGPTNAGFVPYSAEVMYEQRGFGYYSGQSSTDGTILLPITSAGATPTAQTVATALGQFAPFLAPETDNSYSAEMKSAAVQGPMAGLVAKAKAYFDTDPDSSNGCPPNRYLVLMTDGLPTLDLDGNAWPPLGSAAAVGYHVTATFNATDHSLLTTNDQALTDVIANLAALKTSGVKTYIVGLGAGVDPTKNPVAAATLRAMAVAGGTSNYFAATSPIQLSNDLQNILGSILAATQSVASVAVNSTGLSTTTVVYQSQFLSSDASQDWTGNLYAFPVNTATGVVDTLAADAVWSAAHQLDQQSWLTGRLIATWDPTTSAGTPFRWNTSTTAVNGIASSTVLGQELTSFAPDPSGQHVLEFLRGSNVQEVVHGGQLRNRTHKLGDIVFSNPDYVGPPAGNSLSPSYAAFAQAHALRPAVLYVGADDGMLHAFDALTGNERFAYIPKGVYGNLINLASPYYNSRHLFYVDGSPRSADVQFADNSWHTMLFGTEAAGGSSVFALDISDPAAIISETGLSSAVKWDFTDVDMGLGYATPAIANTISGTKVFLGNGYDSSNEKPFLYVLTPETGAVFAKVDLCAAVPTACNMSVANGLSTAIAVNTNGQTTAAANMVYAGDLQGNLWRIDVSNLNPAAWVVTVLLQARDSSGNVQPITTAPVATLNPKYPQLLGNFVFVGTGRLLGVPDLSNVNMQTIYGVYDPPTPNAAPLTRASLVQQTLSAASIGMLEVAVVTGNAVSIPSTSGWYVDLTLNSGERVVNNPLLKSGALVITSTQPSTSSCAAGGTSFSYVINYATGSAFPSPQFDANADGKIDSGDTVTTTSGTLVPVGVKLGTGFYANATIVNEGVSGNAAGGSCPIGYYQIYSCPESGSTCTPRCLKGSGKRRIAWWEVRS